MSNRYNSYKKNKKDNKNSLIKLYEEIETRLLAGSNDLQTNAKIYENIYIIESNFIVKLKKFLEKRNNNIKDFNEKIKIIDDFEELKNIICNGEQFGFVNKSIKKCYKIEQLGTPYELYFGYRKNLIYINNDSILLIIYIKLPYPNGYTRKYYICQIHNRTKRSIGKNTLIKTILNINVDKLISTSYYKKDNIELIELKINKEKNIENQNILSNQNIPINAVSSNNFENKINNTKIQNISNQFINNNNQIEESIKESIPFVKESIKINPVISQINNNQNNNKENIIQKKEEIIEKNDNDVPKVSKLNSPEEKNKEEKSLNYEEEKLKISYEKQIGESLLNDLSNTKEIQLNKNIQRLNQLENEIDKMSKLLNEINKRINELNDKINNNKLSNELNELDNNDNITKEQKEKRKEFEKKLNNQKIEENNKKKEELYKDKKIIENKLNKKIQEKNEIFYIIENLKQDIQQGNNIKYNKDMLQKSIEETELLNKINKDKEELRQLKNKINIRTQLNAENIIYQQQQEIIKEKQKKLEEEKEQEKNKLRQEI